MLCALAAELFSFCCELMSLMSPSVTSGKVELISIDIVADVGAGVGDGAGVGLGVGTGSGVGVGVVGVGVGDTGVGVDPPPPPQFANANIANAAAVFLSNLCLKFIVFPAPI